MIVFFSNIMARISSAFPSQGKTPRILALTSLDNYFADPPADPQDSPTPANSAIAGDPTETIASLQREQQRLTEELASERHRSESLKATFTKSLSDAMDQQRQQTAKLRAILETDSSSAAAQAVALLGEAPPSARVQDSPRTAELVRQVKSAQENVAAQKAENEKLKEQVRAMIAARDERTQYCGELKGQIEEATARRKELKEKLRSMATQYKAKEAEWKEKIAALDAELEERA
jgi:septal ring factor EnvC (AmiA/AmiB activator)